MRIPISKRLLCCASFVKTGARVYDVGCDHGYLGIYLLTSGTASHVTASDIRQKPLDRAMVNASHYKTIDRMSFSRCDGLRGMRGTEGDTVIIAGMGGDTAAAILGACGWIKSPDYALILQPQSSGNDLRRYLGGAGFSIGSETLVRDGGFIYSVLTARFGDGSPLSPGHQYVSEQLRHCGSPLLDRYYDRVIAGLTAAVRGIQVSKKQEDAPRLAYYETALTEVLEMRGST